MQSCLVCCIDPPRRKYCLRSFRLEFPRKAQERYCGLEPDQSTFDTSEVGRPGAAAVAWVAWEDRQDGRRAAPPTARLPESLLPEILAAAANDLRAKARTDCPRVRCGCRSCLTPS